MLNFCLQNIFLMMNRYFQHKEVHRFSIVINTRNEKAIIEYVLINRNVRQKIYMKSGNEINTNHFLDV